MWPSPSATTRRRRPEPSRAPQLGRKHRPDYWLLLWCAALLAIGLVVVYAISPALAETNHVSSNYYVGKQLIAIGLSLVAFIVTSQVPLSWWRRSYKLLLAVASLATLLALILPVNPNYPAHRWVRLGSFSFQSVEVLKFAVLIWLAGFLAYRMQQGTIANIKLTLRPILGVLLIIGLVVAGLQSDLGSAGVMVVMMASMAFARRFTPGPYRSDWWRYRTVGGLGGFGYTLSSGSSGNLFNPDANCQSTGYQACQSLISVGSGGLIGLGLGSSVQAYGYQPEAANDSIFAIYAEKFGFVGSVLLLVIFMAFFARLKRIAERLPDDFSRLLVIGVLAWFATQALVNIGGMIGLLPLKGITLPFISYGGTSVVFAAAAVGLVFQASQYAALAAPRIGRVEPPVGGGPERSYHDNTLRRVSY